jgi:hypothetical protein
MIVMADPRNPLLVMELREGDRFTLVYGDSNQNTSFVVANVDPQGVIINAIAGHDQTLEVNGRRVGANGHGHSEDSREDEAGSRQV